ncbi:uncharacterized protein LOC131241134 [Magnolia sinica]|uniref:uncharacterized protein LOC131241134 n=1 Tax=Magnolia sinica TaxID=86752 RepID=UPI00265B3F9B|nr:uncharacterized protein LOC131241134 [Magnolia sinica]
MAAQVNGMASGWPLGLENMNMRLRLMDASQAASFNPNSFNMRSISSSSLSSSDLDTESTKSFFQEHSSVTLGRLIGIKPGDGDLYFTSSGHHEEHGRVSIVRVASHASERHKTEVCQGICVPLILSILVKMTRARNSSGR